MKTHVSFWLFAICGVVTTAVGCGSAGVIFREPSKLIRDPGLAIGRPRTEKHVAKVVALWEASLGTGIDGKPARGFAGQILFFGPKSETGSRVRGTVVVYEYDDYDPELDDDLVPLHSFTFEPDAWDVHRTEGTLGHSYSCFIPYVNKHKDQVNCGLKVEFTAENGHKVTSEITEVLLPSRSSARRAAALTRGFVRHEQLGAKPVRKGQTDTKTQDGIAGTLDSLTIPLPKRQH